MPAQPPIELRVALSDGTQLAADVILPEGSGPFPVLATFYPYRKDDFIGTSCSYPRAYFADAGYATLLVDIRGYGGSGGSAAQTWDPQEAKDGAEVVQWTALQPWCDGNVGIWGTSYGAAQALAIAAERPPALKAIAAIYGAADIYNDFVYPGGCTNAFGTAVWSAFVLALELAPPSHQDAQGAWIPVWQQRLQRIAEGDISSLHWPLHERYDEYWEQRRIDVERIEVPVWFLSGWRDLLCGGSIDAYRRCRSQKRLIAGPWSHAAPDLADPAFDWLSDLRDWFDNSLKPGPAGIEGPSVVYHVQGEDCWRSSDQWPPTTVRAQSFYPCDDGSLSVRREPARVDYTPMGVTGWQSDLWYPMGLNFGVQQDQSLDDALSICFTSDPLEHELRIAGSPAAKLQLQFEDPAPAQICLKLVHLAPDGRSTLISSGWRCFDASVSVAVDVELYPTAYVIPAGHRLRWTVSGCDFPRVWPTQTLPRFTLISADGHTTEFVVPALPPHAAPPPRFVPPAPPPRPTSGTWAATVQPLYESASDNPEPHELTAGMTARIGLKHGALFCLDQATTASCSNGDPATAKIFMRADLKTELASGEAVEVEVTGAQSVRLRRLNARITRGGETIFDHAWTAQQDTAV